MSKPPFTAPTDEPTLPRHERRGRGVYYTPPEVVRQLVALVVARSVSEDGIPTRSVSEGNPAQPLRVLDPACGAGAMLLEAQRYGATLFGVDSDPAAVENARAVLSRDQTRSRSGLAEPQIWLGDSLFDSRLDQLAPFDAIVANPPYVSIRQLAKSQPAEYVERLRQRFCAARGNFDLYAVFMERALELLREGGRCGMIVPNKWATLDYARPLRELLLAETTLEQVVDLSSQKVFAGANVYPQIVVFANARAHQGHTVSVGSLRIPQCELSADAIRLHATIDVESRVTTRPLGELCRLSCGTPGYSAKRVASVLQKRGSAGASPAQGADFITSGNIDRYAIRLGDVRLVGRAYQRPILPIDSPVRTDRQRRLFAGKKIVIAGLSQRLEAAWDQHGLALGVQVFAASEFQVDPQYLLALLNSKLLTYLFRTRFAAKRLAGGYMAINKGQLARLPIAMGSGVPVGQDLSCRLRRESAGQVLPYEDAAIDQHVYRLYRLTKVEIAEVEAHFADLNRRAA
jgi:SAM-dependent methyltransferase